MDKQIQKCPLCGTKLKMKNGRMTCKECGYYLRDQNESAAMSGSTAQSNYGGTAQSNYGGAAQPNYSGAAQPNYGNNTTQPNSGSAAQPNYYRPTGGTTQPGSSSAKGGSGSSGSKFKAAFISVISVIAVGIVTGVLRYGLLDLLRDAFDKDDSPSINSELLDSWNSQVSTIPTARPSSGTSTPALAGAKFPESDFFRFFIETVYGKGYRSVTAEEYAAVTLLELNRDDKVIYYQLGYGDIQSIYYISDSGLKLSDLSCFPGLEFLSLDDDLRSGDLKGLNNLYAVYAENTFTDLAKIIPHPENITELGVYDWTLNKTLSGIESFPNLLYLSVDYSSLADISALSAYPDLLGLELIQCDNLTDYSPLMSMTKLQELSIQSSQLKTIDFIKQMPNLVSLSISGKSKYGTNGSKIQNINALASCPELLQLSLVDNNNVTDYSVISGLTNLYSLELGVSSNAVLPSLKELPDLERLSLKGARDLSPLRDAPNVTMLTLERCTSYDLDAITVMQDLMYLRIKDFANLTTSLAPLTQLPNLVYLDLSDSSIHGYVEEIFGIPSLQFLYMDNCQVGIDFSAVPKDTDLEVLSMSNVRILKDPSYNSGEKVYLSEHYEFFESFPNLTELYLESSNLDSIDFVENMPGLLYLDISNNNVTSLTPLLKLKDFNTVWCGKNTILENLPSDGKIQVLTTSRD